MLWGIYEWRSHNAGNPKNQTLLLLPFAMDQGVILPGESQTLVWREGRFMDLLDEAAEDCQSVMGVAIMGEDHLLPIVGLCEITSYSIDAGFRGKVTATVTLKCVGRAKLQELQQVKPFLKGRCHELVDDDDDDDTIGAAIDADNHDGGLLTACLEIVKDVEKLLEPSKTNSSRYQQAFWQSLTALGYTPTTLLTRDPSAINTRKELEAASWATLSLLSTTPTSSNNNPSLRYQGMQTTDLLERLQLGRNALLQEQMLPSEQQNIEHFHNAYDDSGFE
eukprot:scaffold160_cov139-Amphora_coffeaeformis.AAC.5